MSATPAHDADLLWAILESLPHAVIAVERNGNVRVLNAAAKRVLGLDAEPLTHGALDRMFRLLDGRTHQPIAQPFDHLLRTGSRGHRGIYDLLVRADGSKPPIEHSLSAFGDDVHQALADADRACYANQRAAKARGAVHPPGTLSASHALSCQRSPRSMRVASRAAPGAKTFLPPGLL